MGVFFRGTVPGRKEKAWHQLPAKNNSLPISQTSLYVSWALDTRSVRDALDTKGYQNKVPTVSWSLFVLGTSHL